MEHSDGLCCKMRGHDDSRVVSNLPSITSDDWKLSYKLIEVGVYRIGCEGFDEPQREKHRNLYSRQRGLFPFGIIYGEEWRLLVEAIIFKSWDRS